MFGTLGIQLSRQMQVLSPSHILLIAPFFKSLAPNSIALQVVDALVTRAMSNRLLCEKYFAFKTCAHKLVGY
jgi:hypothetical protein